ADEGGGGTAEPAAEAKAERDRVIATLRSGRSDARQAAIDSAADLADSDPEVIPALVELLKDKTVSGRPFPGQVNSAREAAALALTRCGSKGEAALRDRGLNVLRDGLSDPSPAVREHSAYTLGQLGPKARPAAAAIQKLCTDPDPTV